MPLQALSRHIALIDRPVGFANNTPIIWHVGIDQFYLREELNTLLASPCDERVSEPGVPQASLDALWPLSLKLGQWLPCCADGDVRHYWAGLRTFAPDRKFVLGPDPRCVGLYWFAGLGGHGMTASLAAGECLAEMITGRCQSWVNLEREYLAERMVV